MKMSRSHARRRPGHRSVLRGTRMISIDDFRYYADDALRGMVGIVSELGDDLANRRPDVPGANSPFAILTHCLVSRRTGVHRLLA